MANKQVTIFGGTGFIGRYVVDRFADLGYDIRVATRSAGMVSFLKPGGNIGQIVPILCDIHHDKSIKAAIEDSDTVINLIGILAQGRGNNTFKDIHQNFPRRLGKVATKCGVKTLVHVSSMSASEKAPAQYLKSKARGEKGLRKNFTQAVILRPSIVFGVEDNFFNRFASMAMISPVLPLIGGGKTKFQPVYVCDVAQAIIKCATDSSHQGQSFDIAGPETLTFKELLQKMLQTIGRKRLLVPMPWAVANMQGWVLQRLPGKLLTRDQVRSLKTDSITQDGAKTLNDLGITPTPLDVILPIYLDRFKPGGRFGIDVQK